MLLRPLSLLGFSALLLTACSRSSPLIPGLDSAVWRKDPFACQDQRTASAKALMQAKEQFYGSTSATIENLLGRPDEEELAEQTEKTYYYYLEPGRQCEPGHLRSSANKLSVHFGALGTVTEILTERPVSKQQPN